MVRRAGRQAYRAGGFLALTAAMLPVFLAHHRKVPEPEKETVRDLWVRRWARALLSLFAVTVEVTGATVPPPTRKGNRGRLIVANHRSAIDIGVLLGTFGGVMVSRDDLANWPIIGAAARAVGTVFVDRKNAESGAATIRSIQKHLEDGATIILFPEGTTFEGDEVRPFFGGAFIAAARAGAEVLPVGLAYPKASGAAFLDETFPQHLARMAKSGATRMALAIGAPIDVEKGSRAGPLTKRAHDDVTALVLRARMTCGT